MSKVKRPTIDEGKKKVILTRLFGDNYCQHPEKSDKYLGYLDGIVVEVYFCDFICYVSQITTKYGAVKFGNLAMNKFFATRGLRCFTEERINFDRETCAHVFYDNDGISFYFWYRNNKENAA